MSVMDPLFTIAVDHALKNQIAKCQDVNRFATSSISVVREDGSLTPMRATSPSEMPPAFGSEPAAI